VYVWRAVHTSIDALCILPMYIGPVLSYVGGTVCCRYRACVHMASYTYKNRRPVLMMIYVS